MKMADLVSREQHEAFRLDYFQKALQGVTDGCTYDEKLQCTVLSNGLSVGTCTNSARLLQEILGGSVVGYYHAENPTAKLGDAEGGHDFLVLPDYIVDWWAMDTYGLPALLHRTRDAEAIAKAYGDPERWVIWIEDLNRFVPYNTRRDHGVTYI